MKLKQEVFATPEFNTYARANLVLVEIDLPRGKPLSLQQLITNQQMQERFRAEGFPTIVVLNGDGREVWRLGGYAAGTPADWIRTMDTLKGRTGPIPGLLTPFVPPPAASSASAEQNKS
jgi:protein disulfide-isomerase